MQSTWIPRHLDGANLPALPYLRRGLRVEDNKPQATPFTMKHVRAKEQ